MDIPTISSFLRRFLSDTSDADRLVMLKAFGKNNCRHRQGCVCEHAEIALRLLCFIVEQLYNLGIAQSRPTGVPWTPNLILVFIQFQKTILQLLRYRKRS